MKPILFNTEMVRAIIDGRKTEARRLVKPQDLRVLDSPYHRKHPEVSDKVLLERLCEPPYLPGDILYVRETWAAWSKTWGTLPEIHYKADAEILSGVKWRPSIHMPYEAARLFLRVKSVKVERLQDIDEDGAKAEGSNWRNGKNVGWEEKMQRTAVERFAEIWDSAIKKSDLPIYGWDADPWVWVTEFERISREEAVE